MGLLTLQGLVTPTRALAAVWEVLLGPLEVLEALEVFLVENLRLAMMTECCSRWTE